MALLRSLAITPHLVSASMQSSVAPGDVRFDVLLPPLVRAPDLVDAWRVALDANLSVSEAILFEAMMASGAAAFAQRLPRSMTYLKTLHTARERASIALYDYARDINWRRPVLFVQAMSVARGYLRDVVGHARLTPENRWREFTGRLGVATVLISRFSDVTQLEIVEATTALRRSLDEGNDRASAVPYLLEAGVLRFDSQPDPERLLQVLAAAEEYLPGGAFERNSAVQLAASDAYLRLASFTEGNAREAALDRAARSVDLARQHNPAAEDQVRVLMLDTLIAAAKHEPGLLDNGAAIGLRVPFGARGANAPALLRRLAPELAGSIMARALGGDLLARGVCADLLALDPSEEAVARLRQRVELRRGNRMQPGLRDERSVLLGIRDSLLLASVDGRAHERARDARALVELATGDETSATPLVILAQDVEANGSLRLDGRWAGGAIELVEMLASGDSNGLLALAAERALASPDLAETPLGGRSEVTTVGDYYGLVSENFTVKQVSAVSLTREAERLTVLQSAIDSAGLGESFGLVQHLVALDGPDGMKRSVRRFILGRPVLKAALEAQPGQRVLLLKRVAQFLSLINSAELRTTEGVRKELKQKEVGRWLRAVGDANPLEAFDEWWALVSDAPSVRRRDSHLDNWVLAEDGRIHALDLEATGYRPMGYELAQITDDAQVLSPSAWSDRREVFASYVHEVADWLTTEEAVLWRAYQAAVAARALRRLTWDQESAAGQAHAQATLDWLAQNAESADVRSWVERVLVAWRRTRGLSDVGSAELLISEHRRRRLSRSMSYHLRHASVVALDEDGWASIRELTEAIGGNATESEIAVVASTLSDPRFEYRDGLVRARYGHSRVVPGAGTSEGPAVAEVRAYHATSLEAAHQVVELGLGLQPMSRMLVHLSRSPVDALRSGARHGYPLLLSTDSQRQPGLAARGGKTLVAPHVKVTELAVESLVTHWSLLPSVDFTDSREAPADPS